MQWKGVGGGARKPRPSAQVSTILTPNGQSQSVQLKYLSTTNELNQCKCTSIASGKSDPPLFDAWYNYRLDFKNTTRFHKFEDEATGVALYRRLTSGNENGNPSSRRQQHGRRNRGGPIQAPRRQHCQIPPRRLRHGGALLRYVMQLIGSQTHVRHAG